MDVSLAILIRYLIDALASNEETKHLEVSPKFNGITIMRNLVTVMCVQIDSPNVYYQRTIPRYVGDVKIVSAADPDMINKIVAELYGRSWKSSNGN